MNFIPINYLVISIGMVSCLLLIFFWSKTSWIFRAYRSVALLSLSFFLSLLDCTSMVTFADYMTRFRREFTSAVFLGESLTTILPSLLAIAQGNGRIQCIPAPNNNSSIAIYQPARFSVSIYFMCIFLLLTLSFIAFVILQWTNIAQDSVQHITNEVIIVDEPQRYALTRRSYFLLSVGCVYTSSVLFGVLLSISTYVLMPYGHQMFYLGTVLSPWMLSLNWILGIIKPCLTKRYRLHLALT